MSGDKPHTTSEHKKSSNDSDKIIKYAVCLVSRGQQVDERFTASKGTRVLTCDRISGEGLLAWIELCGGGGLGKVVLGGRELEAWESG